MNKDRKKKIHDIAQWLKGSSAELDCIERDLRRLFKEEKSLNIKVPPRSQMSFDYAQSKTATDIMEESCDTISDFLFTLDDIIRALESIK